MLEPFFDSLAQVWSDFNRMHRGGLGGSPRGLADYKRNRWLVGGALILLGVASVVMWIAWRL
jgi:hypothetical protein